MMWPHAPARVSIHDSEHMFQGRFIHSVDAKGRVSIPAPVRAQLAEHYGSEDLFLTIFKEGDDKLLHLVPRSEWDAMLEKIASGPRFQKKLNDFRRIYVSGATECVPDKQGRVALSPTQRAWADIDREVVLVGTGLRRLELWNREAWDRFHERTEDAVFGEIGDVLEEIGL